MPIFYFNDKEIEFEKGDDILTAVIKAGEFIPHYCYHPGLSRAATCRMCMVDIVDAGNGKPLPKLQTACSTPAAEGMRVVDGNEKVLEGRHAVMEFLLVNHPLDCPICDQAGECTLQEFSFQYGSGQSLVNHEKRVYGWRDIGTFLQLERNRCIHCTRCVRFTQEVSGTHEMGMFQRNHQLTVDTFIDKPLSDNYQGNLADICPVGALTLKDSRFRKRVWKLKSTHSVCGGCARGCNIFAQHHGNKVYRFKPRENGKINRWWMCDLGRVSFHQCFELDSRQGKTLASGKIVNREEARLGAGKLISGLSDQTSKTLVLGSPHLLVEEIAALKDFALKHCPNPVFIAPKPPKESGNTEAFEGDKIRNLLLRDRSPNSKALKHFDFKFVDADKPLEKHFSVADFQLALVAESPLWEMENTEFLRSIPHKIFLNSRKNHLSDECDFIFPVGSYLEKTGTFVNWDGYIQRTEAAVFPEDDCRSVVEILASVSQGISSNDSLSSDIADYFEMFLNHKRLPKKMFLGALSEAMTGV